MPRTDTAVRNAKGTEKPCQLGDGGWLFLLVNSDGRRWKLPYWRSGHSDLRCRATQADGHCRRHRLLLVEDVVEVLALGLGATVEARVKQGRSARIAANGIQGVPNLRGDRQDTFVFALAPHDLKANWFF